MKDLSVYIPFFLVPHLSLSLSLSLFLSLSLCICFSLYLSHRIFVWKKYLGELVLERNENKNENNIRGITASTTAITTTVADVNVNVDKSSRVSSFSSVCSALSNEEEVAPETYYPHLPEAIEFLTKGVKDDAEFSVLVQSFGHCLPPSIPVPQFRYGNSEANVYQDAAADDANANDNANAKQEEAFLGGIHIHFDCVDLSTHPEKSLKDLFAPARTLLMGTGWRSVVARTVLATALTPIEELIGARMFSAKPLSGTFHQDMTAVTKVVEDTIDRCVPLLTKPWTSLYDAMYHNQCTTEIAARLPPQSLWSVNQKILVFASAIAEQAFSYSSTDNQEEVARCFYYAFALHQGIGFGSVLGTDPQVAATTLEQFYASRNKKDPTKGWDAAEGWAVGLDLLQHGLQVFLYYINDDPMADNVLEFTKWHWLSILFVEQMAQEKGWPEYMTDFTVHAYQKSFVPLMMD